MLRLNNIQRDWFNIVDDCGSSVVGTLEDLHNLNSEIVKQTGMFSASRKKEKTIMVILEDGCNCEKIQMELSDSAYRLLSFLIENNWLGDDTTVTEIDETGFERFV